MDKAKMSRGWRRLLVLFCTLLLAVSTFMILGVTVWAQEQPEPTEQPADTTEEPTAEPTQEAEGDGLVIDYWEPEIGTRTVYYTEDINDIHGNLYGTSTLGYWDAIILYLTSVADVNYASSYYYNVAAISNMNPVYFDLEGPWYFNMTTPFKYIEEVIGIHEAPEAAEFPEATYAVRYIIIASGGTRIWGTSYRSNDATEQRWQEWGMTVEFFIPGEERSKKYIYHYRSPHDKKMSVATTIMAFPVSIGSTFSYGGQYIEGEYFNEVTGTFSYNVIAEGQIAVPGGIYDALLLEGTYTSPPNGEQYTAMNYMWFAPGVGFVADAISLPNVLEQPFGEATDIMVLEEQTISVPVEEAE